MHSLVLHDPIPFVQGNLRPVLKHEDDLTLSHEDDINRATRVQTCARHRDGVFVVA